MKPVGYVVAVLGLLLVLLMNTALCAQKGHQGTVVIEDMAGRSVRVKQPAGRVIGIEAGALRLITYLQATGKVVGVEQFEKTNRETPYIMAHPELADLPPVGPIHGGDAELIVAQDPDVIFWTYTTAGRADDLQRKTGIPVIVLEYGDLGTKRNVLYRTLRLVGKVLGKEERAGELIGYIEEVVRDLEDRSRNVPDREKPAVYVGGIGFRGSHGIVSTEPAYAPFTFVNAKNVAGSLGVEHAMVSKEQLLIWNPDIMFIDEGGLSLVMEDLKAPHYRYIKACRNGELYGVLPFNYYTTNFATVLANAYYIGSVLYPERFADINPEEKADEIYRRFTGRAVYQDMRDMFGGFKRIELDE